MYNPGMNLVMCFAPASALDRRTMMTRGMSYDDLTRTRIKKEKLVDS